MTATMQQQSVLLYVASAQVRAAMIAAYPYVGDAFGFKVDCEYVWFNVAYEVGISNPDSASKVLYTYGILRDSLSPGPSSGPGKKRMRFWNALNSLAWDVDQLMEFPLP
jgi:hypothetical protein